MTQREKAKAYDNIVNKLRRFMAQGVEHLITRADVQDFFPELAENEDERIRKELHIYLDWLDGRKDYAPRGEFAIRDMIAWLEKQEGCEHIKKDWLEHIKQSWYKEGFIDGKYSCGTSKEWTINDAATLKELIDFLENGTAKLQHDLTRYAKWLKIQFTPIEKQGKHKLANSAKTCKNDTLLDLLNKMPSCITVDGLDYHFVMKKTSIYLAYYACYNGNREEYSCNAIFWMTAFSPIDLLAEMLEILKEKGLLE